MRNLTPTDRLIARLIDADVDVGASGNVEQHNGVSARDVVLSLQRNKVPLLVVASRAPAWLAADAVFQQALAEEQASYDEQRREYAEVQAAWRAQGITCLMIKTAGNAPSFPHTSDNIDVLVPPPQAPAARQVLRDLGYVELRNIEEPHKFLFRRFHNGVSVSAIHVHEQVIWLVGFMDEAALWARKGTSQDDPLVEVPSPEDAILINLAHACYENKLLKLNDVVRVRHALRTARATRSALDWSYMERVATSRGWLDGLAFLLLAHAALEVELFGASLIPSTVLHRCGRHLERAPAAQHRLAELRAAAALTLPLDLSYWFCKRLYYRKVLADQTLSLAYRVRDVVTTLLLGIKLKSRIRPQPGFVVTLSGGDGTGKTAHARALVNAFRLGELKVNYLWTRGGSTGLTPTLARLGRLLMRGGKAAPTDVAHTQGTQGDALAEDGSDSLSRRRKRLTHPVVRCTWAWLVALDQVAVYVLRAQVPALFGRIVVADRYVYDTAVEMDASLPRDARWSRLAMKTMLRLAPRPSMGYLLDVSAATRRDRKKDEVWHDEIDAERERYRTLAARYDLCALSTEGSFAASNDVLIWEVIMNYMRRYETWLNALFLANPSQKNAQDAIWQRAGLLLRNVWSPIENGSFPHESGGTTSPDPSTAPPTIARAGVTQTLQPVVHTAQAPDPALPRTFADSPTVTPAQANVPASPALVVPAVPALPAIPAGAPGVLQRGTTTGLAAGSSHRNGTGPGDVAAVAWNWRLP